MYALCWWFLWTTFVKCVIYNQTLEQDIFFQLIHKMDWMNFDYVLDLCHKLQYLFADMKGIHKMRLTAISA